MYLKCIGLWCGSRCVLYRPNARDAQPYCWPFVFPSCSCISWLPLGGWSFVPPEGQGATWACSWVKELSHSLPSPCLTEPAFCPRPWAGGGLRRMYTFYGVNCGTSGLSESSIWWVFCDRFVLSSVSLWALFNVSLRSSVLLSIASLCISAISSLAHIVVRPSHCSQGNNQLSSPCCFFLSYFPSRGFVAVLLSSSYSGEAPWYPYSLQLLSLVSILSCQFCHHDH